MQTMTTSLVAAHLKQILLVADLIALLLFLFTHRTGLLFMAVMCPVKILTFSDSLIFTAGPVTPFWTIVYK